MADSSGGGDGPEGSEVLCVGRGRLSGYGEGCG